MTEFLTQYGYGFIALVVMLESLALPLPGESLVVASGMLASNGKLNIVLVLAASFFGSIVGDNIGYWVGRRYGRAAVIRWGDRVGFGEEKLAMVEERFRHYGFVIVLIARFVFILRQLNGFVAGMMRMRWLQFVIYNAISAALWTAGYGLAAYFFGQALQHVLDVHSTWVTVAIAAGVCLIGMFGTYRVLFDGSSKGKDKGTERPEGREARQRPD